MLSRFIRLHISRFIWLRKAIFTRFTGTPTYLITYPNSSNKSRPRILTRDRLLPNSFYRQVQYIIKMDVFNSLCWSLHSKLSKKVWHLKIGPSVQKLWTFFCYNFRALLISRARLIWRIMVVTKIYIFFKYFMHFLTFFAILFRYYI